MDITDSNSEGSPEPSEEPAIPHMQTNLEEPEEEEEDLDEEEIVHMVGLEDLSMGLRMMSPHRGRWISMDCHSSGI